MTHTATDTLARLDERMGELAGEIATLTAERRQITLANMRGSDAKRDRRGGEIALRLRSLEAERDDLVSARPQVLHDIDRERFAGDAEQRRKDIESVRRLMRERVAVAGKLDELLLDLGRLLEQVNGKGECIRGLAVRYMNPETVGFLNMPAADEILWDRLTRSGVLPGLHSHDRGGQEIGQFVSCARHSETQLLARLEADAVPPPEPELEAA